MASASNKSEEFVALLFDNNINNCFEKLERLREKVAKLPSLFRGT
jgi:hypothetical protein